MAGAETALPPSNIGSIAEGDADLPCRFDDIAVNRHDFSPANRFSYRDRFHLGGYQRDHPPKGALADQPGGSGAEPRTEHAIKSVQAELSEIRNNQVGNV